MSVLLPAFYLCISCREPLAPIKAMMPGFGWYGDQTGHRQSCDSQVKGGIDFLIRSSTQIELQLNFSFHRHQSILQTNMGPKRRTQRKIASSFALLFSYPSLFLFPLFLFPSILKCSTVTLIELSWGCFVEFYNLVGWKASFLPQLLCHLKKLSFWPLSCFLSACSYRLWFVLSLFVDKAGFVN